MKVINLIRDLDPMRLGVVRAATDVAPALRDEGVETELWHRGPIPASTPEAVHCRSLPGTTGPILRQMIREARLDRSNTVVVTHGPWGYQTSWGHTLGRMGFPWVYVPQGALEPWALRHKRLRKSVYFRLFERPMASKSDAMRASSLPEERSLRALFPGQRIELIRNGITLPQDARRSAEHETDAQPGGAPRAGRPRTFLFLARLHVKKGPLRLADAWLASSCNNDPSCELVIAGPDDGQLKGLERRIARSANMRYVGPVYGETKESLLAASTFYVLPSLSEGLPSSVLDATARGLVPLITEGCNIPELLIEGGAVRIGADAEAVRAGLEAVRDWSDETIERHAATLRSVLEREFNLDAAAQAHVALFRDLLARASR